LVTLEIVSNVSGFKPALNLNWVLTDLNGGSNSFDFKELFYRSNQDKRSLFSNKKLGICLNKLDIPSL